MIVSENYANAFSEVLEILFCMPESEYKKIPNKLIKLLEENHNPNYHFYYEADKTLDEQNVLIETKEIIALIYRDYWADSEKKRKIIEDEKRELEILEKEKQEKYNPDNIFRKKQDITIEPEKNQTQLIEYKESVVRKILNKIKTFFKMK